MKETYLLQLADNALVLGQRMGEWCGHGAVLEQDIAMTNISLDLIGQARLLYQYIAELRDDGSTEDDIAYLRKEHEYLNCLLVEQQNGDFAQTIVRQFFYDVFDYINMQQLSESTDTHLAAIAAKSLKEVKYHLKHSREWVIRLGDGTEESHNRMQKAVNLLFKYTGELFEPTEAEKSMIAQGIAPDLTQLQDIWKKKVDEVMNQATLEIPETPYMQSGGKSGRHSEQMGYILADLQYMQRTYPGVTW